MLGLGGTLLALQLPHCLGSRFARNDYATSAFNEYFLQQLREIEYPNMQVSG